ncbi:MAG: hypothetical protein JWR26_1151 [Pedosphaera sp.]|nr:hypothetical protein [Pedosphaera sp.]
MNITVEIIDRATPAVKRIEAGLKSGAIQREIGGSVVKLVRDHFHSLPPNKYHFPTTRFWQRAADATNYEAIPDGVRIRVNQVGVRQRFFGGPIDPKHGRYLTIPAIAETYGCSAADFSNLIVVRAASTDDSLVRSHLALAPASVAKNAAGLVDPANVYFWLVAHVWQEGNPEVLPEDQEIIDTALAAARRYLSNLNPNPNHK